MKLWFYDDEAWCALYLTPNKPVTLEDGGPTEEGYSYSVDQYVWDTEDGVVYHSYSFESRDCDGHYDRHGEQWCKVVDGDLERSTKPDMSPEHAPPGGRYAWQTGRQTQRDHTAEDEGY